MILDPTSPTRDMNRKLLMNIHQDGLLDVLAGLIVITFGLIPILDDLEMGPGLRQIVFFSFYFAEVATIILLKRSITLPRAGMVVLSRGRRSRILLIMLLTNVSVFILFAALYIFDIQLVKLFGSYQLSIPLGLIFLLIYTVAGALLKAARFFGYGLIVLSSFIFFEHLYLNGVVVHHGIPSAAFISGGIVVLCGLYMLKNFLSRYKLSEK